MPSLIAAAASPHCIFFALALTHQSSLSISNRPRIKMVSLIGVSEDTRMRDWCSASGRSGSPTRCSMSWENEGDFDLEAEILEFMRSSRNPNMFPTKKQLLDSGRKDLVDAIVAQGGWLSLGWDSDGDEEGILTFHDDFDFRALVSNEQGGLSPSSPSDSSPPASYSGVSQEFPSEDSSGVEGILSRLEKERNITFGVSLRDRGVNHGVPSDKDRDDWSRGIPEDETVGRFGRRINHASLSFNNGTVSSLGAEVDQNAHWPDLWRTWSSDRAGFSSEDFEAAEINTVQIRGEARKDFSGSDYIDKTKYSNSASPRRQIGGDQIEGRLRHLETELSLVLQLLRSKANSDESKDSETVPEDLQELSDAWEFQENEIMHAQDKLRSIRAKLAVLEGKMALSIIDAQKTVEQKQKRVDETRRAQRLLRTACIVWHNPANEVLLSGSFDGWASQRKMERSSTSVFSLCLNLYPGRYEIKFIVDGVWKVDPLRPIAHDNGYENNLLIIT